MRFVAGTLAEDGGPLSVGGERARVGGSVCSEENTFVCEVLHYQVILGASISSHVIQTAENVNLLPSGQEDGLADLAAGGRGPEHQRSVS